MNIEKMSWAFLRDSISWIEPTSLTKPFWKDTKRKNETITLLFKIFPNLLLVTQAKFKKTFSVDEEYRGQGN